MTNEEFAAMKEDMLHPAEPVLKVSKTVLYIDMAMTLIIVIAPKILWCGAAKKKISAGRLTISSTRI